MLLPARIGRLHPPVLCFIVSRETVKGDVEKVVAEAVAGGVTMVQLREKEMQAGELLAMARRLKLATRGKALLVVNDRVDVAIAAETDGVHLPEQGLPTLIARGLLGKYAVLGRSVHGVEAAVQAGREGAEYVIAGTIYKSPSKPDAKPAGTGLISDITKAVALPVLAVGGIAPENVAEVVNAGAAGIAVISAIASAKDPRAAAAALSKALTEAWAARGEALSASA